ncbi:MAG: chemotaxis protein CheW [Sulfuricurvum sp.]|nr:chemotaxis protein CheW [Sulfuricurvum sp.]MDP3022372.1 chemotaxis protein CheW [Sulfuricurvum sp.]
MEDYIIFTIGDNYYALSVASIQRIIQVPFVTAIPNAHPMVEGMMSYEDRVIKVVNFRSMMGMENFQETTTGKSQKLLIYQTQNAFFGIKVDQIEDIKNLDCSTLKHVDKLEANEGFVEIDGVVEVDNRLVNVIKSVTLPMKEKV